MRDQRAHQQEYCELLTTSMRALYSNIGEVFCPALGRKVRFTAKGFHHVRYESDGTPRSTAERIYKLTLLPLAVPVIKNCKKITEERDVEIRVRQKSTTKKLRGKAYSLVTTVGKNNPVEIRVIVRHLNNTRPIFWSIMKN